MHCQPPAHVGALPEFIDRQLPPVNSTPTDVPWSATEPLPKGSSRWLHRRGIAWIILWSIILVGMIRIYFTYSVFSQAYDEPATVSCGMQWLQSGAYDLDPKHPPLARVAAAFPLYMRGVRSDRGLSVDFYVDGNRILGEGGQYWTNLTLARLAEVPFLILACLVVFAWTSWIWGRPTALVAVALFGSLPAILGHSGLAMTDMSLVATLPAALFAFCLWLESPSLGRSAALGLATGLAVLSKLSALAFLPGSAIGLVFAYWLAQKRTTDHAPVRRHVQRLVLSALVAALVIWAGYRFSINPDGMRAERDQRLLNQVAGPAGAVPNAALRDVLEHASYVPVVAYPFFRGIFDLIRHNDESDHWNLFLGEKRNHGWWYYYPVALAAKTPFAFLLLLPVGIVFLFHGARTSPAHHPGWRPWTLLLPCAAILLTALLSHVNIGIRHILPIYVMLSGIAGFAAVRLFAHSRQGRVLCVLLLLLFGIASASAHPDYLAYFNELAAGSSEGNFGVDSDLDWGQDLARLPTACARQHIGSLHIAYFGSADLSLFDLPPWKRLAPEQRESGWIAISVFSLKLGTADQPDAYAWLEPYRPVDMVGKSIRLYFIPPDAERQ
jgi:4-amino-4-deoxy-L-arabinose transferase-like glycosyltransferase